MANVQPHLKPSLHHRFRNTLKQLSSLIFIASLGRQRGCSTYICLANIMLRRTEASSDGESDFVKSGAPDGSFPKPLWIYLMRPSGKDFIESVWKGAAKLAR